MADASLLTAAFYRFVDLPDCDGLRPRVLAKCTELDLKGTVLLAPEGINGTLAGRAEDIESWFRWLAEDARFCDLEIKRAAVEDLPFHRMKVRLKKEIITLGIDEVDPVNAAGRYVEPEDWNAVLDDPGVVVVDTRNDYEVALGTFDGAVNPQTASFGELPEWLASREDIGPDTPVAMFCTGGIRCEKSTALLRARGVRDVMHLRGGILNYLENVPEQNSRFDGHCFVFDERVAVGHDLAPGPYTLCRACRYPLSQADRDAPEFVDGVSCARCHADTSEAKKAGLKERQRQVELANSRNQKHIGRREDD